MIDGLARDLIADANFAAFTTILPDGKPMTHIMWIDCDDDYLLINTVTDRQKYRNVRRNPSVVVTVWDRSNPYTYAEVRGRVVDTAVGDEARQHINRLSLKYLGRPYPASSTNERVILKIAADTQRTKTLVLPSLA